jgi:phosphatidate cytidylyltransferase
VTNALQRVLTAVIAVPIVLVVTYVGGWPFGLMVCLAGVIAQHELYGIARARGGLPFTEAGLTAGGLLVIAPLAPGLALAAIAIVIGIVLSLPFATRHTDPIVDVSTTLFGIAYPSSMLATAVALRVSQGPDVGGIEAFWIVLTTMLLVWATDTFAYYAGRSFGKHLLAPTVSPKKTWEGAVGGVAGAVVVAALLKILVLGFLTWFDVAVIALICGAVSQLGDLAESRLKRSAGVKDSGSILPGHGGVLDRLDALIVAFPLVYLYLLAAGRVATPL